MQSEEEEELYKISGIQFLPFININNTGGIDGNPKCVGAGRREGTHTLSKDTLKRDTDKEEHRLYSRVSTGRSL